MFSRVWKPEALALVSEIVLVNQLTTTRETRKQGRYSEGIDLEPPLKTLKGTQKQANKMAELETENGVITDPVQIAETLNDMFANVASRQNINNTELGRFS